MDAKQINSLLAHGDRKRIAEAANVGTSTVTRVLTGAHVQAEYVEKVLKEALRLIKKRNANLKRVEKYAMQIANHLA